MNHTNQPPWVENVCFCGGFCAEGRVFCYSEVGLGNVLEPLAREEEKKVLWNVKTTSPSTIHFSFKHRMTRL